MVVDGAIWETLHENATDFVLSEDGGSSAASVQVKSLGQADIFTFQEGVYSIAVNGEAWPRPFVNAWNPAFDSTASRVAAAVRHSLYEYGIAVDGVPWKGTYACVWEPTFNPATGQVNAPVRIKGAWGLAVDDHVAWAPVYSQLWHVTFSEDGRTTAAIVAPSFGAFTVAVNGAPWSATFPVVTDLVVAKNGRAACLTSENNTRFAVCVDGKAWGGRYDMAFAPVFSDDGAHVAAVVEKNGKRTVVLDDMVYKEWFDHAFTPVFSPDGRKVLIRGISGGKCMRVVASPDAFHA